MCAMYVSKLVRMGNSTGVTLSREALAKAGLARGDEVVLEVQSGRIEITPRPGDSYATAMAAGRSFAARYRRAMAILAK